MRRPTCLPRYGRTLVHSYCEHPRRRLVDEPDAPVTRLLAEIRRGGGPARSA
jgi:hypothetical protein